MTREILMAQFQQKIAEDPEWGADGIQFVIDRMDRNGRFPSHEAMEQCWDVLTAFTAAYMTRTDKPAKSYKFHLTITEED